MLYHVLIKYRCGFKELIQVKSNKELQIYEELFSIFDDEDIVSLELMNLDDVQKIDLKN